MTSANPRDRRLAAFARHADNLTGCYSRLAGEVGLDFRSAGATAKVNPSAPTSHRLRP